MIQTIQSDWIDLENGIPFDVWDIENNVRKFYIMINYDEDSKEEEICKRLISTRKNVDSSITLLINLLKPEDNKYIKKLDDDEKTYRWMIDNIGRSQKRIDSIEKELCDEVIKIKIPSGSKLLIFARMLHEYVEHFVYYPLKKARLQFIKIKEKDGEAIVKDEKLFLYFVFCEIFHSSEMFGGLSREEIKSMAKNFGTTNQQPNILYPKSPPNLPENVETEKPNPFEENEDSDKSNDLDLPLDEGEDDEL